MTRTKKSLHRWKTYNNGEIDIFAYESGEYHNGPACDACGFSFCHHCNPEGYKTSCPHSTIEANDKNLDGETVAFANALQPR